MLTRKPKIGEKLKFKEEKEYYTVTGFNSKFPDILHCINPNGEKDSFIWKFTNTLNVLFTIVEEI